MPDMQLSLNMHELDMENCKNKRKMNRKGYYIQVNLIYVKKNRE